MNGGATWSLDSPFAVPDGLGKQSSAAFMPPPNDSIIAGFYRQDPQFWFLNSADGSLVTRPTGAATYSLPSDNSWGAGVSGGAFDSVANVAVVTGQGVLQAQSHLGVIAFPDVDQVKCRSALQEQEPGPVRGPGFLVYRHGCGRGISEGQ